VTCEAAASRVFVTMGNIPFSYFCHALSVVGDKHSLTMKIARHGRVPPGLCTSVGS
jgi:hypothetical protein